MQEAIILEKIHKTFGSMVAVNQLDLRVSEGEIIAILGPSGCGKTTTLRIIAGFETPDSGQVILNGKDITHIPAHKRNIGMMFQNYALFPHLSVFENIAFGLKEHGCKREEIKERVDQVLNQVRMSGFEKRSIKQLSGGEQQRIALARALVVRPAMLLMDEPLGALDRKLREEMQFELKEMLGRLKLTGIFVTHDQEEALTMSDRIAVMNKGNLEQVSRPTEIYESPETIFCATFLGLSNILEGQVNLDGNKSRIKLSSGIIIETPPVADRQVGCIMIRPEKIILSAGNSVSDNQDIANHFTGRILNIRYLGAQIEYKIELSKDDHLVARQQTADGIPSFRIDQIIQIYLPVSGIRWLER
jgi:spermidine/putrescine ABC transporter ATP-binding subunit